MLDFKSLFESAPGFFLVLNKNLTIMAVTDDYLKATMVKREDIVGKYLFDIFPDNPRDTSADGVHNLSGSLARVLKYKMTDWMPVQKYDIRKATGEYEVRYWSPVNKPVLNSNNEVEYIIHRAEDITEFVTLKLGKDRSEMELFRLGEQILTINKKLKSSRQEIQDYIDAMSTMTVKLSVDGKIVMTNQSADLAFGLSAETNTNFIDGHWWPTEKAQDRVRKAFTRAVGGEHVLYDEWVVLSGKTKCISLSFAPVKENDVVKYVVTESHDITARKEVEQRYVSLAQSANDAIITANEFGEIMFWNIAATKVFGYEEHEIMGSQLTTIIPPEFREAHAEGVRRYLRTGDSKLIGKTSRIKGLRKDGTVFPGEISISTWKSGDIRYFTGIVRDISDRMKAEEALHMSEERFRLLINEVKDYAIFFVDVNGNLSSWNKGGERIFGYNAKEVLGKHYSLLNPADQNVKDELQRAKRYGRIETDGWRLRKDGSLFWANIIITAIYGSDGKMRGFSKIVRDITERMKIEEDLKSSNHELEQFAYVASHDLQEPLRMVSSYCQLIERRYKDKLDQDGIDFIGYAVDGAKRMQALINDLLQYSRVGTRGNLFVPVDAKECISHAIRLLSVAIEETNATITVGECDTVLIDESQIVRVFQNLIGNAIKFHRDGVPPVVHITCEKIPNGMVKFCVEDNGIGIAENNRDRLFVIFQRLNPNEQYQGTGIGLAICQKIIKRHFGAIWFESELGKGSKFYFTLQGVSS